VVCGVAVGRLCGLGLAGRRCTEFVGGDGIWERVRDDGLLLLVDALVEGMDGGEVQRVAEARISKVA
jgi:hypothetical protein